MQIFRIIEQLSLLFHAIFARPAQNFCDNHSPFEFRMQYSGTFTNVSGAAQLT